MHKSVVWARCGLFLLIGLLVVSPCLAQGLPPTCSPKPVLEGCGTITWPDGSTFTGGFHNGMFNGHARVVYADGAEFEGDFTDAVGGGHASFVGPDGAHIAGAFKDGDIDTDRTPKDTLGDFPFWRKLKKSEANIHIFAIVTETGDVTNVMADVPDTFSGADVSAFNAALANTILKWKCRPAMINNQPVRSPAEFNVVYHDPE